MRQLHYSVEFWSRSSVHSASDAPTILEPSENEQKAVHYRLPSAFTIFHIYRYKHSHLTFYVGNFWINFRKQNILINSLNILSIFANWTLCECTSRHSLTQCATNQSLWTNCYSFVLKLTEVLFLSFLTGCLLYYTGILRGPRKTERIRS